LFFNFFNFGHGNILAWKKHFSANDIIALQMKKNSYRCQWVGDHPEMIRYHDRVWGRPERRDRHIFRALVLDAFQAGLSWKTILLREPAFRRAFRDFNPVKVAQMTKKDVGRLLKDKSIIRHRGKIQAAIENAKRFLETQKEYGSFSKYIWSYTKNGVIMNHPRHPADMRRSTALSEKISKDLRKRGFRFVGPTMTHAFMQGIGMVNDHEEKCVWKYSGGGGGT
jgi:DNA-3-methyladenine glycosylase I